jgi:hypothetical protein
LDLTITASKVEGQEDQRDHPQAGGRDSITVQCGRGFPKIPSGRSRVVMESSALPHSMLAIIPLLAKFIASLFKSRRRLEAENLFPRHQLNIALRQRLFERCGVRCSRRPSRSNWADGSVAIMSRALLQSFVRQPSRNTG